MDWFRNRTAVLATMHSKEQVIAPILEAAIAVQVTVPQNFDTDQFGTFTREIDRAGSQLEAARRKIKAALQVSHQTLGVASEGSFGAHPVLFGMPYNQEIVVLLDQEHEIEIVGQAASTETNYRHQKIQRFVQAAEFAQNVGFPEHGLIVMPSLEIGKVNREHIIKGITDINVLESTVNQLLKEFETVHIETDMRAMHNPTRMKVIAQATQNLVEKIAHCCPNCGCPGFDVVEFRRGLPCSWCAHPTTLIRSALYQCQKCQFQQESLFPNGQEAADPSQCEYCNP